MGPCAARVSEASGIIDPALEGDRNDRADTGHAHQLAADGIIANDREQRTV